MFFTLLMTDTTFFIGLIQSAIWPFYSVQDIYINETQREAIESLLSKEAELVHTGSVVPVNRYGIGDVTVNIEHGLVRIYHDCNHKVKEKLSKAMLKSSSL